MLQSASVDNFLYHNFFTSLLIEIVIVWVYYTIPFGFNLFLALLASIFNFWTTVFGWLRITDNGSVPEIRK